MIQCMPDAVHRRIHTFSTGGCMSWSLWSWLSVAGIVCWCGLLSILHVRALAAGATATSLSRSVQDLLRRLTSCEELQNECALAISRIEARDKMRRVRSGQSLTAANAEAHSTATENANQDSRGKLSDLPTAEIRRRLAMRIPIQEKR